MQLQTKSIRCYKLLIKLKGIVKIFIAALVEINKFIFLLPKLQ